MHFINAILKKLRQFLSIYVDVNVNTILHHCCFTAPLIYFNSKTSSAHSSTINPSESLSNISSLRVQNVLRLVSCIDPFPRGNS